METINPDIRSIVGASTAAVAEYAFGDNFALQTELGYIRKGFGLKLGTDVELFGVSLPVGVLAESRFDYLEMPLLAKGKFGSDNVKFYGYAGPAISYATGARLVTRSTGLIELDLTNTKLDLDALGFERWDISAMGGAGVEFNAGFGKIFVDGRYTYGFSQLYDIPLLRDRVENRGLTVSAGIVMPF